MTQGAAGRDATQIDAMVTDRYLDALLAAHEQGTDRLPRGTSAIPLRTIADRLARDLPRFHPSFRFEEALAARLERAAIAMRSPRDRPRVIPFPAVAAVGAQPAGWSERPWIITGAVTSAALSIAGAAYVAWRRGRPSGSSRSF